MTQYPKLFLLSILLWANPILAQQARSILLKKITKIPLPDSTSHNSIFYTTNEQPEIIATGRMDLGTPLYGTILASSTLGAGKLLLFGSSAYFEQPLLQNKDVKQLLLNSITWGRIKHKRLKVAVINPPTSDLVNFLKSQHATVFETKNFQIPKHTEILFLTEDVKDSLALQKLERFIRNGGTLIFGSPYSSIFKNRDKSKPYTDDLIEINELFAKAGIFNAYTLFTSSEKNMNASLDSIPWYSHINSIIPALGSSEKIEWTVETYMVTPTVDLVLGINDLDAPILKKLKLMYQIPDSLRVPTPSSPVDISTPLLKTAYKIEHKLYEKQHAINKHPEFRARGSDQFPGRVPETAPRVNEKITIQVKVGTQGLFDRPSVYYRPHSTGLYIPPGEKVKVITSKILNQHLKAQIGVHSDNLMNCDRLIRTGQDLTKIIELDKDTVEVFSPYGGLLMINISDTTKIKSIALEVKGAVKAPFFKLGETSETDWVKTIRNYEAPWAELVTDNIVLTVPAYRIRQLDNPVKLMEFWDEVMNADADLAVISNKRVHQERIIVDQQVAYGYMFTAPERIVVPDDNTCEWMLNENFMRENGSWGHFHELGHRHQFWGLDYDGLGEVTVNLFTLYVYDKVLKKGLYSNENIPAKEAVVDRIKKYLSDKPSYEKFSNDPFVALNMYIQLIENFGWEPIIAVNKIYRNIGLPKSSEAVKPNQERIDLWFTSICEATNKNLSKFFDIWKIPVSEKAKLKVAKYASWMPDELQNISF